MVRERLLGEEQRARRRSSAGGIESRDKIQAGNPLRRKLRGLPRRCPSLRNQMTAGRAAVKCIER